MSAKICVLASHETPPRYVGEPDDGIGIGCYAVYQCLASDGTVVYVGQSSGVDRRVITHRRAAAWFSEVAQIVVEYYDTPTDAADREYALLLAIRPRHNIRFTRQVVSALAPSWPQFWPQDRDWCLLSERPAYWPDITWYDGHWMSAKVARYRKATPGPVKGTPRRPRPAEKEQR